jgi:endonuclease-3 related protein
MDMYHSMFDYFGPQKWWPGESVLEIMVGAVLTQNTNWKNVEKAITNLKQRDLLSIRRIQSLSIEALAEAIRPSGYYNVKAKRLKNLIAFLSERYHGDLSRFREQRTAELREGLLSVKGVGLETADSILLYAAQRPVFVIDAYTFRILRRHGLIADQATYHELQALFEEHLPADAPLFNEFHALIVMTGKEFCRPKPPCRKCPLREWEAIDLGSDLSD